jgi:RNA polymerase sigma-70 factor (ECF subfamily)
MARHVSDSVLLERFVSRREEAAFVDLVNRHLPRVEGTCRRLLLNEHDVEDVCQATFLVLARKAAGIPWRASVGSWLCAVAHRLAMNARVEASRRGFRETPFASLRVRGADAPSLGQLPEKYHPITDPRVELDCADLRRVLDDELLRLPEKYRAPVVLCDLEGRTHQEAAEQLGWPSGSISRRLFRARALLRKRLVHRGVILATGLAVVTVAACLMPRGNHDRNPVAVNVRQLMLSLKPVGKEAPGCANFVASSPNKQPFTELTQVIAWARRAGQVASELQTHDPGKNREKWRELAGELRLASEQLSRGAQENDQPAMLVAAHRLDASCLKCHEVFRQ